MVEITWDSPASMLAGKGAKSKKQSTDTVESSNWVTVGDVLQHPIPAPM
jgi:hypothetical protein